MEDTEWLYLQEQFEKAEDDHQVDFGEFMALVQHESFFREVLIESLIRMRDSACRLSYLGEHDLVEKHIVEAQNKQSKGKESEASNNQPRFSFDIDEIKVIEFMDEPHIIVFFRQSKSVQLFNYATGHFVYDFDFMDEASTSNNIHTTFCQAWMKDSFQLGFKEQRAIFKGVKEKCLPCERANEAKKKQQQAEGVTDRVCDPDIFQAYIDNGKEDKDFEKKWSKTNEWKDQAPTYNFDIPKNQHASQFGMDKKETAAIHKHLPGKVEQRHGTAGAVIGGRGEQIKEKHLPEMGTIAEEGTQEPTEVVSKKSTRNFAKNMSKTEGNKLPNRNFAIQFPGAKAIKDNDSSTVDSLQMSQKSTLKHQQTRTGSRRGVKPQSQHPSLNALSPQKNKTTVQRLDSANKRNLQHQGSLSNTRGGSGSNTQLNHGSVVKDRKKAGDKGEHELKEISKKFKATMQGSFDVVLDWQKRIKGFETHKPWIEEYYNIQENLLPQRDFGRKDKDEIVKEYMKTMKNFGKSQVEEPDALRSQKFATASTNMKKQPTNRTTMLVPGKVKQQATLNMAKKGSQMALKVTDQTEYAKSGTITSGLAATSPPKILKADCAEQKDPIAGEVEALSKHVRRITEANERRQGKEFNEAHELPVVTCKASRTKKLKPRFQFEEEEEEKLKRFTEFQEDDNIHSIVRREDGNLWGEELRCQQTWIERQNPNYADGPDIEIMLNDEGDLNEDLNIKSPTLPTRIGTRTSSNFNNTLKSARKKTLGATSDFGHRMKGGTTNLKRKDSTCSVNSSRKGLTKNSSNSSLYATNERNDILKNRVNYNLIDDTTEKGMKQKIKLKKEEIERANKEFERIKEILWINQKRTSYELNDWTLQNAVYSQYRQMMDKQIIPLFSGEKQESISSHYMSTQQQLSKLIKSIKNQDETMNFDFIQMASKNQKEIEEAEKKNGVQYFKGVYLPKQPNYQELFSRFNEKTQALISNEEKARKAREEKPEMIVDYYDKKKKGSGADKKKVNLPLLMCYHKLQTRIDVQGKEDQLKEEHLCIFAFYSTQIVIRQLRQSANSINSIQKASIYLGEDENKQKQMPMKMDAALSKVNNKLIICVAVQTNSVIILQYDEEKLTLEPLLTHKMEVPDIVTLMYRPKCGLIVGCFRGYIELLELKTEREKTKLQSLYKWENEIRHKDDAEKKKEQRKKQQAVFSDDESNYKLELQDQVKENNNNIDSYFPNARTTRSIANKHISMQGVLAKGLQAKVNSTRNKSEVKSKTMQGPFIPDDDSEMGVMMPYTPVRGNQIDMALGKLINERRVGINGPPLEVQFRLKNKLEEGVYEYGTSTVIVKLVKKAQNFLRKGEGDDHKGSNMIQDKQEAIQRKAFRQGPQTEEGEILISHGGTWNTFRKFINKCEAKELEKVERHRAFRQDPMSRTREVNRKRREIAYRAKNWEPWGQENLSIGGGDKQKKNKTDGGTTVISLNYSEALNYVAFGGSKGQIGVLDATTLTFKGLYEGENAHEDKVESLYFYDEELLLITVARDSEVILWDAQKMVILHRVKMGSKNIGGYSHINTNTFYPKMGMLLMCTQSIFKWQASSVKNIEIKNEQEKTVAEDYKNQYIDVRRMLGIIPRENEVLEDVNQENAINRMFPLENKSLRKVGNVLASPKSHLAAVFVIPERDHLFTLDFDCLIRLWDLVTGECIRSYPLECQEDENTQNEDQGRQKVKLATNSMNHNGILKINSRGVQFAKLAPGKVSKKNEGGSADPAHLVFIALEKCYLQVNNVYSGALIYNKSPDTVCFQTEISDIVFFNDQSKQWAGIACWEGAVHFLARPGMSNGVESIKHVQSPSSHKQDIVSLDVTSKNNMVSGSIDNVICFRTAYTGKEKTPIHIPKPPSTDKFDEFGNNIGSKISSNFIHAVRFADYESSEFVIVIMSEGEVFILESATENFQGTKKTERPVPYPKAQEHVQVNSMVAVKKQKMLTVGECGNGSLFDIEFRVKSDERKEYISIKGEDIGRQQNQVTVKFKNRRDFKMIYNQKGMTEQERKLQMPEMGTIVSLELNPESRNSNEGNFIVGLKSGKVFIFDLETCQILAAINSNDWVERTMSMYNHKRQQRRKSSRGQRNRAHKINSQMLEINSSTKAGTMGLFTPANAKANARNFEAGGTFSEPAALMNEYESRNEFAAKYASN